MMTKKFTRVLALALLPSLLSVLDLKTAVAAPEAPAPVSLDVKAFSVDGDNPLSAEATAALLKPFLGRHVGLAGLQAAADALEQAIRARGNAFHRVVLPPQETTGSVRLSVVVFRISGVEVKGSEHFPREVVLASLPSLAPDAVPDNPNLAREIALANEHPTRQIAVFMRESEVPDHLMAEVRVADQNPQSAFATLNNTGPGGATGRWRLSLGVQKSNLFDADHALTASYTTAPDKASSVEQWGLFYRLPLYPLHSALSLYASDSNVQSGTLASTVPNSPFEVSGQGRFYGAKLTHRLRAAGDWGQQVEVGIDDKLFANNTRFNGAKIGIDVRSRPLTLRYEGQYLAPGFSLRAGGEVAANLGGGSDNDATAYAGNNPNASPNWSYWRANLEIGKDLADGWTLQGRVKLQETTQSLISGEQFGIGGSQSVRGFEEREASGDRGWQAGVELGSPLYWEALRWQLFYEQGEVRINRPQAGQLPRETAASAGVGLRWQLGKNAQLSLDLAHVLDALEAGSATQRKGFGKTHVGLVASF